MKQALTVLSVWPRTIVDDLRREGRTIDDVILNEAGLDLRAVNREGGRVPWQAQARLFDIAARELGDDCYGVHLAAKVDVRDAGPLAYVGLASHTLGEAIANLARYVRIFNEVVHIDLTTENGVAILDISGADPSFVHYRQQMEFGTGLLLNLYRFLTKRRVAPMEVQFVHGRRRQDVREVSRYLGCKISYLQSRARIVLKASDTTIPIDTSDHRLLKILKAYCEAVLEEHGAREAGLVNQVERRIVDLLPKGAAMAKVIATELGMSERTMTRRLAGFETNFSDVLDRIRKQLALKYVTEPDLSLSQISFLLGYANQPAFSLAFRRWMGKAPSEFRRSYTASAIR